MQLNLLKYLNFTSIWSQNKIRQNTERRIQLTTSRPSENSAKIKDWIWFPFKKPDINWGSHVHWYYKWNNDDTVHGPFSGTEMNEWHLLGYFATGIKVRPAGVDGGWRSIVASATEV
jgi:hypothetical protein